MLAKALLVLLAVLAGPAAGGEVYRWVGPDGGVHFGDRPAGPDARVVEVDPVQGGQVGADRRRKAERLLEAFERRRERERQARAEARREERRQAARCERARRQLRGVNHGGPVYYRDDQDGRVYLDEAERTAARRRIQGAVDRWCR